MKFMKFMPYMKLAHQHKQCFQKFPTLSQEQKTKTMARQPRRTSNKEDGDVNKQVKATG